MGTNTIANGDLQILEDARVANPAWFDAIMVGAEIMSERRKKWSGKSNPFTNFIKWAQAEHVPVEQVFRWALSLKVTRDQDSEALDDSLLDNDIDKVNYSALAAGWRMLSPAEKMANMLEVGVWIDSRLLVDWKLIDGQSVLKE